MTKVCRLCLTKLQRGSKYFNINAVESFTGFMPYRDQLTTCIPEMALDLVPNPVICNNCRTALKSSYDFKSRCLMVEKKIRNYVASQPQDCTFYNLSLIDTANLPKPTKFEPDSAKDLPKLVPILPKTEAEKVQKSQPSSILSNLLTVKDDIILSNSSEIEITNVGVNSTLKLKSPQKIGKGTLSEIIYTPVEKDEHGIYTCNHCGKKFINVSSLHTHKLRVHEEDYLCNFCNVPFKSLQNLRKHNQQCQKMRIPQMTATNPVLTKRPHLPTKAKNHLKRWLFNHTDHPYPTDVEKQQLMKETNLSLLQVENWFINARRRILADLTKLRNMRGRSARGRRGGRGRARAEVEEDLFDEDPEKIFMDEESRTAQRLLSDLADDDAETLSESGVGTMHEDEEETEIMTEMPEEFLEESLGSQEEEEDIPQGEIITATPLETVLENSDEIAENQANDSAENSGEDDPLEHISLANLPPNIKMEIDIDER